MYTDAYAENMDFTVILKQLALPYENVNYRSWKVSGLLPKVYLYDLEDLLGLLFIADSATKLCFWSC